MKSIYYALTNVISIKVLESIQNIVGKAIWYKQGKINREIFDDYSATSAVMVESILDSGLEKLNVLSVGGCISHIVPLLPMFDSFAHCTMIPIEEKDAIHDLIDNLKIQEYQGDFFDILGGADFENVNFVISHVTLHCMNDTRYHNKKDSSIDRPYSFATHLTAICPNVKGCVLSTVVSENESIQDNNVVLSESKLVDSFNKAGFSVKNVVYDKYSTRKEGDSETRITKTFPHDYCRKNGSIVATYYFGRENETVYNKKGTITNS